MFVMINTRTNYIDLARFVGIYAVVLDDIPDNSVVVGMPAKVVKSGIDAKDFY